MKYVVKKNKKTGEYIIDYFKVEDKYTFRIESLKKLIKNKNVIIIIDTNLLNASDSTNIAREYEYYFKKENIKFRIIPTENRKAKRILGIKVGTEKGTQYKIIFYLNESQLSKELYDKCLKNIDYAVGVEPHKNVENIFDDIQKGYLDSIFNKEYFENSIYDSLIVNRIRSTIEFN